MKHRLKINPAPRIAAAAVAAALFIEGSLHAEPPERLPRWTEEFSFSLGYGDLDGVRSSLVQASAGICRNIWRWFAVEWEAFVGVIPTEVETTDGIPRVLGTFPSAKFLLRFGSAEPYLQGGIGLIALFGREGSPSSLVLPAILIRAGYRLRPQAYPFYLCFELDWAYNLWETAADRPTNLFTLSVTLGWKGPAAGKPQEKPKKKK